MADWNLLKVQTFLSRKKKLIALHWPVSCESRLNIHTSLNPIWSGQRGSEYWLLKHKYINLFTAGMLSFLQGFCCGLLRRLSWMSWRKVQKTISDLHDYTTGKYLQLVHVFSLGNVKFKNSNKVKSRFLQIHLPVCLNATSTGFSKLTHWEGICIKWGQGRYCK